MEGPFFLPLPDQFCRVKNIKPDSSLMFAENHDVIDFIGLNIELSDWLMLENSAHKARKHQNEADAALICGVLYIHLGNWKASVEKLNHATEIFLRLKDVEKLKLSHHFCGNANLLMAVNAESVHVDLFEILYNENDLNDLQLKIFGQRCFQKALELHKKYLLALDEICFPKHSVEYVIGYTNLGLTTLLMQDIEKALKYLKDAVTTASAFRKSDHSSTLDSDIFVNCLCNFAVALYESSRYVEALQALQTAESINLEKHSGDERIVFKINAQRLFILRKLRQLDASEVTVEDLANQERCLQKSAARLQKSIRK